MHIYAFDCLNLKSDTILRWCFKTIFSMRYAISLSLVLVSAIFVSFVIEINEKMEVLSLSFARVPRNKLPNQASWAFYLPPLASLRRFYI